MTGSAQSETAWTAQEAALSTFMSTFDVPAGVEGVEEFLADMMPLMNGAARGAESAAARHLDVGEIEGWRLNLRMYPGGRPSVVLIHGGAWTMGSPQTHEGMAQEFCRLGYTVFSVDYPRAPRWRFPAGLRACAAAFGWLEEHAPELGVDVPFAVLGDSAGANLAAGLFSGGYLDPGGRAAVLMYGIFDYERALPALGPLVGGAGIREQLYVDPSDCPAVLHDPGLSPLRGAERLPAAWIGVGTRDPLVDESLALSRRLDELGRTHVLYIGSDAPHSFLQMPFHSAYRPGFASIERFLADRSTQG